MSAAALETPQRLQICISSETFSPRTYNGRFTLHRYNAPKYSVFIEVPLMSNILRPLPCASRLMLPLHHLVRAVGLHRGEVSSTHS